MFNHLVDIFRSRRFANLTREPSDFPGFMLHDDIALLHMEKKSDTAFGLLLKLVVQAADDLRAHAPDGAALKLKKLLSLAIPVASFSFTRANPPSGHELSKLYNSLSAVAVAIFIDRSPTNVRSRLAHARRYVKFADADMATRQACIRGMMHLTILLRRLDLPTKDTVEWLTEMTTTLVDEYEQFDAPHPPAAAGRQDAVPRESKPRVVLAIQMVLGSVRRIIDSFRAPTPEYPDPAFLNGRTFLSFPPLIMFPS